jgi:20S proteasome alpha/beta subunit
MAPWMPSVSSSSSVAPQFHANADYPGMKPGEASSGTTIVAWKVGPDTVILGADSRVSTGTYVANRTSDKIAQLSPHIYACRSGSAADTQTLTEYVRFYLQQLRYALLNDLSSAAVPSVLRCVTIY